MKNSINALRVLSMDEINNANSGHPGVVLGFAPVAYTLWHDFLKVTPKNPSWFDRDRFVLASGHASSMLYSLLHLFGFNVSIDDLKNYRKIGSITPGHPEYKLTEGLDSTSGPLGQGIAMAAGMAIAETMLSERFNKEDIKLIDHYTYVECGDGDLQEGVTLEALSLIGHLKLNKLIILYDSNKVQLDGPVSKAGGIKNAKAYFTALGFNYIYLKNVESEAQVRAAISKAKESDKPVLIECNTVIGYGSPVSGTSKAHGAPLGMENTEELKNFLGYHQKAFTVSKSVYKDYHDAMVKNEVKYNEWQEKLEAYKAKYPKDYAEFKKVLDDDYCASEETFKNFVYEKEATRKSIGKVVDAVSKTNNVFIAGSADLTASTFVKGLDGDYTSENRLGRNINYGVREHAMGAIANGMTLHHVRNMTGAFFVFSDYMKPAIRMAALMKLPSIFIFTHDSIAVGEDGPTHEPIEQLAGLRAIPNVNVFRPADAKDTVNAIKFALKQTETPSVLALTRQALPLLDDVSEEVFEKGAYTRLDYEKIDGTLVATGSEVSLALDASKLLLEKGIHARVVEIVSTNLFDKQDSSYKESLIPSDKPSLFVEMASPYGLMGYAKEAYGINRFGMSGNINDVIPALGFTKEEVAKKFESIL